jgi:hypothetical protein
VEIVTVYSASRSVGDTKVERHTDGRRLVISTGWGLRPAEVLAAARPHLDPEEMAEVAAALGLGGGRDEQPPLSRPPTNSRS